MTHNREAFNDNDNYDDNDNDDCSKMKSNKKLIN